MAGTSDDAKFKMISCVTELAPRLAANRMTTDALANYIADRCLENLAGIVCDGNGADCRSTVADIRTKIRAPVHDTAWGLITNIRASRTSAPVAPPAPLPARTPSPSSTPATDPSASDDCSKTVERDGYFTRAQSQCGIQNFPSRLASAARQCNSHLASAIAVDLMRNGMKKFDHAERVLGHKAMCATFSGSTR